ncbi:hypothetical protein [Streptomyces sp. NPDC054865]
MDVCRASVASSYLSSWQATPEVFAEAALHSYSTAYWWAAGLAAVGLVVTFLLYRPGVREKSPDAVKTVAM